MEVAQPEVQFTTSEAGLRIAFWEIGAGPPLVIVQSMMLSHAELEWSVPIMRAWYLSLAKYFRVIRIDPRGAGISDDPPSTDFFSPAGFSRDIKAVTTKLGLAEFNLMGIISMGPTAIHYAVSHPEKVTRLVLCETGPSLSDLPLDRFAKATAAAAEFDVLPSYDAVMLVTAAEDIAAMTVLAKASSFNRPFSSFTLMTGDFDVSDVLSEVSQPTLVIRSTDSVFSNQEQTRRLVAGITNSQLRVVPGVSAPWTGNTDVIVESLVSFLTDGSYEALVPTEEGLRTVVFTDLVSSTELLNRLGDEAGRAEFRSVEVAVSELCALHHGRVVKNLGDGSLISFTSTSRALTFARDLHQRMEESHFGMRIGMAAGEPIQEDADLHGAVVVQASRIAALGQAGETIVSDSVRKLAIGKDFGFELWGETELKGFDEPERLWKVTSRAR